MYAKLERARRHARDVRQLLNVTLDPSRYRFVAHRSDDPTKVVYHIEALPKVSPELSATLGDYLFNLRAALDHLAWHLVPESASTKQTDPHRIQFPIKDSNLDKGGKPRPARILGISDKDVIAAVEAIQPYRAANAAELDAHPLRILRVLNNIDKHRLLLATVYVINTSQVWWTAEDDDPPVTHLRLRVDSLHDKEPVAWFEFGTSEVPEDFDPHLSLSVRLEEEGLGSYVRGVDLDGLIDILYAEVEHSVIGATFGPIIGVPQRHGYTATWP